MANSGACLSRVARDDHVANNEDDDFVPSPTHSEDKIQASTPSSHTYSGERPKNIIIFGEIGVGKSSMINLMAEREIAQTARGLQGCTLEATEYFFSLSEQVSVRIFDTMGLEEPDIGINTFICAIEKAYKLVTSLQCSGGIDLLLFCIRGGRITAGMQRSYRLFFEFLCEGRVPVAIIVTGLEQEKVMEDWWVRNEGTLRVHGMHSVAHACITAAPARVAIYAKKREESRLALREMLLDILSNSRPPYIRDIASWFTASISQLRSSFVKSESFGKKELSRRLEKICALPRADAERLAGILSRGPSIE